MIRIKFVARKKFDEPLSGLQYHGVIENGVAVVAQFRFDETYWRWERVS